MNKFQYKLAQFMMGRRGFDQLSRGLMVLAMILILLDFFVPGNFLSFFAFVAIIYSYFRAFSKNLGRRQAENDWYVTFVENKLRSYRSRDYKHYKYFKCPSCGQTLRAPKGKGKIRVTCSSCRSIFEKKV